MHKQYKHIESAIAKIQKLENKQTNIYNSLLQKLSDGDVKQNEKLNDLVFDYVFNDTKHVKDLLDEYFEIINEF